MLLCLALVSCGPAPIPTGIDDPHEEANRRVHEFNKRLDRAAGGGSSDAAPSEDAPPPEVSPLLIAVSNFGTNLDTPRKVANSLLQVRPGDAAHNTMRFGINSTIGLFGVNTHTHTHTHTRFSSR